MESHSPLLHMMYRRRKMPVWKAENYEKLQHSRDSRVLVRTPGSDPIIQCAIHKISLDDENIKYDALSYVWGALGRVAPFLSRYFISLEGHRFDVTRNLFTALLHMRFEGRDKLLWVDAVCINQMDCGERAQQVRLMHHIYTNAERVVVDLGAHTISIANITSSDKRPPPKSAHHINCYSGAETALQFLRLAWEQENPENWLRSSLGTK